MKEYRLFNRLPLFLLVLCIGSCSNEDKLKTLITGQYARVYENEFDNIRDTLEIKPNDQGTFDVIFVRWTSAKKDDPDRPSNKVAGQWNGGNRKTTMAEFQSSDTSLRIQEQISGRLRVLSFNLEQGTVIDRWFDGKENTYTKVKQQATN